MYKFTIYGECVGKGRPKFSRMGNFVRTYTPEATANYETFVRLSFIQENPNFKTIEKDIPLTCIITIYKGIPKSVSKKKRTMMLNEVIRPTSKPDIDNSVKSIFDALNGVAYHDDSQVVELSVNKYYSETPRVEVVIIETQLSRSEEYVTIPLSEYKKLLMRGGSCNE